ncbi:MAG: TlpA family protein disulfide reductase [Cytophagales bacterium]|nr:TlpA family protein disulfide reductase [Cytophaga sp.]
MKKYILRPITFIALIVCLLSSSFKSDQRKPAFGFTLDNIEGKKVSLSDFKGKVVYIDFWATWCKPCLMEIPHSKTLKQKYADNDSIVFMYISIDQPDNIDGWKAVVEKKGMTGVQLISREGLEEKIIQRYGVQYIPHFVLIDKNGNIADAKAPAPSEPKTEQAINKLLLE